MKQAVCIFLLTAMVIIYGCSTESLKSGIKPGSLRSEPKKDMTMEEVKKIHKKCGFYDRFYDGPGTFVNQFTDNGNGTVTDSATGLMWEKATKSGSVKRASADKYVRKLNRRVFAGHNDWRLPTIIEIGSLLSKDHRPLNIHPLFAHKKDWSGTDYWSADWLKNGHELFVGLITASVTENHFGKNRTAGVKAVRSL